MSREIMTRGVIASKDLRFYNAMFMSVEQIEEFKQMAASVHTAEQYFPLEVAFLELVNRLGVMHENNSIANEDLLYRMNAIAMANNEAHVRAEGDYSRKIGLENNFETLSTNTRGGRSADWFAETGKGFATGIADMCIACAVAHPFIGIGAAHNNTITDADRTATLQRQIAGEMIGQSMIGRNIYSTTASMELVSGVARQTIREAFEEFLQLPIRSQLDAKPVELWIIGVNYLSSAKLNFVRDALRKAIDIEAGQAAQRIGQEFSLAIHLSKLGQSGGYLWRDLGDTPELYNDD